MINKPGRPSIPNDEKNLLATFSLKRWQVQRLKETKNKSKLIQYLLTKHFTSLP
jgi:cytochrome oxidase assembly protein ShyY1